MKKIVLLLSLITLSISSFSQINGNYNYSIGVRGFTIMQMPKIMNQTNDEWYNNTYFNGAMIKFNDNQISYRISGNYLRNSLKFYNNCESCEEADGHVTDYAFKIGFEKNFNYSRIQPYFAFDIGFRSNSFNGTTANINPQSNSDMTYKADATKNGFIASPVIGIKLNPINELSFFVESSLDFFFSYERQELVAQDATNTRFFNRYNKSEFLLNPVSIGVQLHLGSKN